MDVAMATSIGQICKGLTKNTNAISSVLWNISMQCSVMLSPILCRL